MERYAMHKWEGPRTGSDTWKCAIGPYIQINGKLGGKAETQVPGYLSHKVNDQTVSLILRAQSLPQNGQYYCLAVG